VYEGISWWGTNSLFWAFWAEEVFTHFHIHLCDYFRHSNKPRNRRNLSETLILCSWSFPVADCACFGDDKQTIKWQSADVMGDWIHSSTYVRWACRRGIRHKWIGHPDPEAGRHMVWFQTGIFHQSDLRGTTINDVQKGGPLLKRKRSLYTGL